MKIHDIQIGWDIQDITADKPVELIGQYYQRISKSVRDPLAVTALALEQSSAEGAEQVVMVSVDAVYVSRDFQDEVRGILRNRTPGLDPQKIILNATHIHSGPAWYAPFRWWKPASNAMPPSEIRAFIRDRIVLAVENAWKSRSPGMVSYGSASAVTGFCRRTLYADGSAMMYGETNRPDFVGMESGNDHLVRMMFTWNQQKQLTGIIVNVACPSQVMEAQNVVSADFFGELRRLIAEKYEPNVRVLAQVSAAGDQSPRNLPLQSKDPINYWNDSGVSAIGERLEKAVAEVLATAGDRVDRVPVLKHTVENLVLPVRRATVEEYRAACAELKRLTANHPDIEKASEVLFGKFVEDTLRREKLREHGPFDNKELEFVQLENAQAVLRRYETQDSRPTYQAEVHSIRIGECAFVTNPFELYLDYGQSIQARSRAKQTFVVQIAGDEVGYLPTARAVATGGYGSLIINGLVGPEGGQMLVDASVRAMERLWIEPASGIEHA
jgi:hypothetical protein